MANNYPWIVIFPFVYIVSDKWFNWDNRARNRSPANLNLVTIEAKIERWLMPVA